MVIGFICILSPIIIIHELGHFWAARFFDIEVEEFGLGFPPRAMTVFEKNKTKYTLNWIPLGGFVRPAGQDDPNIKGGLAASSRTARFWTLSMGAIFNFITAFFILWAAFSFVGQGERMIKVNNLIEGGAAEAAGFQIGDVFVAIDGEKVGTNTEVLMTAIDSNIGTPLAFTMDRDGEMVTISAAPRAADNDPTNGLLGVGLGLGDIVSRSTMSAGEGASEAGGIVWDVIALPFKVPSMIRAGEIEAKEARPVSVYGISQIAGDQLAAGDWFNILFFTGIISAGLGFANLLPLPALDGGRIIFVLIEAIRGRRVSPRVEQMVHTAGMVLLLTLTVFLIFQDIINPVIP